MLCDSLRCAGCALPAALPRCLAAPQCTERKDARNVTHRDGPPGTFTACVLSGVPPVFRRFVFVQVLFFCCTFKRSICSSILVAHLVVHRLVIDRCVSTRIPVGEARRIDRRRLRAVVGYPSLPFPLVSFSVIYARICAMSIVGLFRCARQTKKLETFTDHITLSTSRPGTWETPILVHGHRVGFWTCVCRESRCLRTHQRMEACITRRGEGS